MSRAEAIREVEGRRGSTRGDDEEEEVVASAGKVRDLYRYTALVTACATAKSVLCVEYSVFTAY